MLGNIIGGFIVILVGEHSAHFWSNPIMHNPEYRLTSLRGQDRSVKHLNYARTTDKGFPLGRIYSLNSGYKMKPEINKFDCVITYRGSTGWISTS